MESENSKQVVADFSTGLFVLYALLGILILVHLYALSLPPLEQYQFYNQYTNIGARVTQGEYYRLFTSMFLHSDATLTHLIFNCLGLYIFGKQVEQLFGHMRFAIVYFLGGLAGSIASYTITNSASIGASGAVFAIFGAVAAYFVNHRKLYGKVASQQLRSLAILAAINLGLGLLSTAPGSPARIDNAAHIGGAVGGYLIALMIGPRYELRLEINESGHLKHRLIDTSRSQQWILGTIVFVLVLISVVVVTVQARRV